MAISMNSHYPLSMQAFLAIHGSNTQDEAQEKITEFYPHYDPCDTTLETPFDTAFKNAVVDEDLQYQGSYCLPEKDVVVIKDHPFDYSCLNCCAGIAGAIEHMTRSSNA